MQLFERLCTTFFTHNAPLVSDGDYYSSEDVFTALPYAKGRRYFDAVALLRHHFRSVHPKSLSCTKRDFGIVWYTTRHFPVRNGVTALVGTPEGTSLHEMTARHWLAPREYGERTEGRYGFVTDILPHRQKPLSTQKFW